MKTEILRMLSPDARDLTNAGGGYAALKPEDIAAALAGLPIGPFYLGMTVHVVDPGAYVVLCTYIRGMYRVPSQVAERIKGDPILGIIDLCLDEHFGNNKCKSCGGTGQTINEHEQLIACETCKCTDQEGNVYQRKLKAYTDLSRAKQARIPIDEWPYYKTLYERMYTKFSDWDAQIRTHLANGGWKCKTPEGMA